MRNTYTQTETLIENDRRPVSVTVTLQSDNPLDWDMDSTDLPISTMNCNGTEEPTLKFSNYQGGEFHQGFEVTFDFVDNTGKGYGFFFEDRSRPDPDDAIWVKKIDSTDICPPDGSKWGGFKPQSVTRDKLIVDNKNDRLQYFGFALLLSLEDETSWSLKLDPVGNNMNGTTSLQ
ncbi:MAG TPA: hypothetical protein VFG41_08670 [Sphingomicrobium sp.]|jgi:hypothetical protein|nr:hypothetical protein [Sphingomicrobium sp.]